MVDRDPLPRWSHGRVTLLGDAAHPMYPIGSNGASQAIIDGEAITQELLAGGDPEVALQRYEQRRLPPMARIVESNRRKGIDVMLDIVEQRAPQGFSRSGKRAAGRRAGKDRRRLQEARRPGPRDAAAAGDGAQ